MTSFVLLGVTGVAPGADETGEQTAAIERARVVADLIGQTLDEVTRITLGLIYVREGALDPHLMLPSIAVELMAQALNRCDDATTKRVLEDFPDCVQKRKEFLHEAWVQEQVEAFEERQADDMTAEKIREWGEEHPAP